jgi:HEAT repeat protein
MERSRSVRLLGLAAVATALASAATRRFDLDVAIPSGAPLEWKGALPQRYVRPESFGAITRGKDSLTAAAPLARPAIRAVGVVRPEEILTLDFAGHLGFQPLEVPRNRTGFNSGERPYPPPPDVDLYWRTTISMLQMLLHPLRVLRLEMREELLILGEGALPGLEAGLSLGELSGEMREMRAAIGPTPPRPPEPIVGRDPYATMMQRLVAQELCVARPYSNDLAFAERLVLLRDDVVPYVIPYLASDHSLARRNAAALLALLESPSTTDALVRSVKESHDLVLRLRAVNGLARRRARTAAPALRAALLASPEPELAAALVRALGEIGDGDAVPLLVNPIGPSNARAELLIERLAALVRIDPGTKRDVVESFVKPWLKVGGDEAAFLRESDQNPQVRADLPDPDDARVAIVEQLARLLYAKLRPDDAARRAAVFSCLSAPVVQGGRLDRFPCTSLGGVAPMNRVLFAQSLAVFGSDGEQRLKQIAADPTCEPELRLTALQGMPMPLRMDVAAGIVLDPTVGRSLQYAALELLGSFDDNRAIVAAEELGRQVGFELRDLDDPLEHWRLLITVQILGRHDRLSTPTLVKLLVSADPRRTSRADPLADRVERFLAEVRRSGGNHGQIRALAEALLGSLVPQRVMRRQQNDPFGADVDWLTGQAEAVLERPRSEALQKSAVRSITSYLKIFAARYSPVGSVESNAFDQVPLFETLLIELARKADDAAVDALAGLVQDRSHPQRAAACLALGASGRVEAGPHLLYALKDDDPFVRLCAYHGLRHLTHHDYFVDWLSASTSELEKAFQEWGRWLVRERR